MMDRLTAEALIDALQARHGIIAVVGAGGKKSTLHRLVEAHRVLGTKRIALTATVKTAQAAQSLDMSSIIGDIDEVRLALRSSPNTEARFLIAAPSTTEGRLSGMPRNVIQHLHSEGHFDVTLVKADGARMRWIKAPNEDEPVIPEAATTIIPIVSARVFGKPISPRIAHRPDRLQAILGTDTDDGLKPHHIARLLTSNEGSLHHVGQAHVTPIINMVDSPELLDLARDAAETALHSTKRYDRILLTSMHAESPVIEMIDRSPIQH